MIKAVLLETESDLRKAGENLEMPSITAEEMARDIADVLRPALMLSRMQCCWVSTS